MNHRLTLYDMLRIVFKRKTFIISLFTIVFTLVLLKITFFSQYEASTLIMLVLKKRPTTIKKEKLDIREEIAFIHTNISLLKSRPMLLEITKRLSLCKDEKNAGVLEKTITSLRRNISIEALTFTNLINIKVRRRRPEEAADVANTLVKVFKEWSTAFLHEEIDDISRFVDSELVRVKNKLEKSEKALRDFEAKKGLVMSDDIAGAKFEASATLYEKIAKDMILLKLKQARLSNLENDLESKGFSVKGLDIPHFSTMLSDSETIKLFTQGLKDTEVKLAYYLKSFTAEHPVIKNILEQEKKMKNALENELRDMAEIDKITDNAARPLFEEYIQVYTEILVLDATREAFRMVIKADEDRKWNLRKDFLPDDKMELARLMRELSIDEMVYKELREDKELIDIFKGVEDTGMVKVVSPPTVPEKPKGRFSTFILGNLIGLFLAVCVAMIIEYRNHSFKQRHEIEADLKIPLLEVFPHAKKEEKDDIFRVKKWSVASDRFFKLVSHILPGQKHGQAQVVQITSSIPAEGKTFVALNMGIKAAELGYRVLLIDANFRNPLLHTVLASDLKDGFVDVLTDKVSIEKALKETPFGRLHLMTCGDNPMRAANIFSTENIRMAIDSLKTRYDIVLIDTAAVNSYVESLIIAGVVDGAVLVIEADRTQKESVFTTKRMLEKRCKIIGAILNNVHCYIPQRISTFLTNLNIS